MPNPTPSLRLQHSRPPHRFPLAGHPVHVCRPGCCQSNEDMLRKAQKLLEDAVICPLPIPALNKWTKLGPTIAKVTLMSHFCGVLGHCLRREFSKLVERVEEEDAASDQEGEARAAAAGVGLPLDERAEWRRVANQRRLKTVEFVEDKEAAFYNLLWLVIASPILVLHWKLFKHARWVSEQDQGVREGQIIQSFCDPSTNPAATVMESLLDILVNSSQALRVIFFFHGGLPRWSVARKLAVQQLVLVAMGQLWRKLVAPWQSYPWRLWPLAFSEDMEERRAAAEDLHAQPKCCLDACFSQKLCSLAPSTDFLMEDATQSFVRACFTRAVATSTFVERRFATYGAWVACRGSAPRLPTLAGKHVTSCFKDFVSHWRKAKQARKGEAARFRPAWVADRGGSRSTGVHIFTSERAQSLTSALSGGQAATLQNFLVESRHQWANLPAEEKARYSQLAKERNAFRSAQQAAQQNPSQPCAGGPWHMAFLEDRWPLRADVLAQAMQGQACKEVACAI